MSGLYQPVPHPHQPRNVRFVHAQERQGINDRVAVFLTRVIGSMPTAYLFVVVACIGLLGILGILNPLVALIVAWASQTLIQLTLLPVIMVSQNVLNRHQELQSDETFQTTQRSYHDIEQVMHHLTAQDNVLLAIQQKIQEQDQAMQKQSEMIAALLVPPTTIRRRVRKVEVDEP